MFFDFIKRNSRKNRKENGIYFASLIISFVAFYVILSLGEQGVMKYLKTVESNAVERLLLIIPMLYAISLFFVFFLIYFANRYQLESRSHEFGVYFMLGMKRSKLFGMIMGETLWNGLVALIIGVPFSLFLTELISLATSRLVGMGIIGHQFRISWIGIGFTVLGFILVQLVAVFILSIRMSRKEPINLLHEQKEKVQRTLSPVLSYVNFATGAILLLGSIFLTIAYVLAILYLRTFYYIMFVLIIFMGIAGTFILFRGLGCLIGTWIRRNRRNASGLYVFTGRQLQENVLSQWSSLAISSLLILMAMVCFTYGISTALNQSERSSRTADFTFRASKEEIETTLNSKQLKPYLKGYYAMKLGLFKTSASEIAQDQDTHTFSWTGLEDEISKDKDTYEQEILLNNLFNHERPYLISISSYNEMLKYMNMDPILLSSNEIAMYSSDEYSHSYEILRRALASNPTVDIGDKEYKLASRLYTSNLVADRAITLSYALIVPDNIYNEFVRNNEDSYLWNMILDADFVLDKGLMQAMYEVDEILSLSGLSYESYLSSMGRQLFYMVAGSYTTFYLGIMFLLIANTVLGLKFLMQQKSTMKRYQMAAMLGASVESLRVSARMQIWLYFGLVILVAFTSSIFGILSMLRAFPNTISLKKGTITIVITLIVFIIFECCYIKIIQRKSDEEIGRLKEIG